MLSRFKISAEQLNFCKLVGYMIYAVTAWNEQLNDKVVTINFCFVEISGNVMLAEIRFLCTTGHWQAKHQLTYLKYSSSHLTKR